MLGAIALVLVAVPASATGVAPGRLCIGSADVFRSARAECHASTKISFAVDTSRLFVFTSADKKRVVLGRLAPGSPSPDLSKPVGARVGVRFESTSKEWPPDAELILKDTAAARNEWHWSLPKDTAAAVNSIELPAGVFDATVTAPHFEPVPFKIDSRAKTDLGVIRIRPLPLLIGKVVDRSTHAPLPGAVITSDAGKTMAVTDLAGGFREELLPDVNPAWINVALPGYGTRTILLTKTRADRTIPTIELDRGGALRVRIARDMRKHPTVTLELLRVEARKQIHLKSEKLSATNSEWVAKDLDTGEYIVIASGDQPLEKLARTASVKAAETTNLDMEIEPIDLLGTVSRGSARVAGAEVTLKSSESGWSAAITTSDEGAFEQELWQSGRFAFLVSAPALKEPYLSAENIPNTPTAHLDIVVPSGTVAGRVVDVRTQKALPGATITLDSISADSTKRSVGATSDDSGAFAFEGIAAGSHSITAEASNYITNSPISFDFVRDNESKQITIALNPADRFPLLISAPDASPIAGASVIQSDMPAGSVPVTDIRGRVDVGLDRARGALLMIVPREGSFALYRVPAGVEIPHEPVPVIVRPATAALNINTLDDATGLPIRNAHVLIRYNGEFIEPALARQFSAIRHVPVASDNRGQYSWSDLPAGNYELWSYGNISEVLEIMQRASRAGATLAVTTGPYAITLRVDTHLMRHVNGVVSVTEQSR